MTTGKRLAGRTALVTGGAVRIGREIALALAAEGANVAIQFSGSRAEATALVPKLQDAGARAVALQGDFSRDPAVEAERVMQAAADNLGPVDLLVNSAAVFLAATLESLDGSEWDRVFNINLKGPVWLSRAFAAQLPTENPGDIVNIADWRALRPKPGHLAYTLAKSALVSATRLLAQELAPRIRVNAVAPGAILPPAGASGEEWRRIQQRVPLRRGGAPADIAEAVVFLASSSFVTGEILHVTGGEEL